MIHRLLPTLLFILLAITGHALNFETGKWYDFEGTLGKTNIRLSLFLTGKGELKGNYCYTKYERKIQLSGTIDGNTIALVELAGEQVKAYMKGIVASDDSDHFDGSWTDSTGLKSFPVRLKLQAICGGTLENRYSDSFFTKADDVESFMKTAKGSILRGDKNWIANHTSYPLKTTLDGKTPITIKNAKQLVTNFDRIFHAEFKNSIKSLCSCNLFTNYQGAMLGNGQIWINVIGSPLGKFAHRITAINN